MKMSFIYLPTGKLHQKTEMKKLKNFPAGYRDLSNNIDSAFSSDFYGGIANDTNIPSKMFKNIFWQLVMQDDINLYVTRDSLNNASFIQKLDPISNNIFRRQNPFELVFRDISTSDAKNPVVGSLLRELNFGKKDIATNLVKKAPKPGLTNDIKKARCFKRR